MLDIVGSIFKTSFFSCELFLTFFLKTTYQEYNIVILCQQMLNNELNFENIDEQEWTERLPILVLPSYSPNVEFERVHFWSLLYFPKRSF